MTDQKQTDLPKIAAPARRALQGAGITTLKQLTEITKEELLQLHGMGPNAVGKLQDALKANGWSFRESKKTSGGKMDKAIRTHLDNIRSADGQVQNKS